MTQMTVHKALCELKLLGDRINKKMTTDFIISNKHTNDNIDGKTVAQWKADTKAEYQSLRDLIDYRNKLKQAVAMSNATTTVTIAGNEYTVAEAIELKNNWIPIMKNLQLKLIQQMNNVDLTVASANNRIELDADQQMQSIYGGKDKQSPTKEMLDFRQSYIDARKLDTIDPLNIKDEIDALDNTIEAFMLDVDSELSRSNAVTLIEI